MRLDEFEKSLGPKNTTTNIDGSDLRVGGDVWWMKKKEGEK